MRIAIIASVSLSVLSLAACAPRTPPKPAVVADVPPVAVAQDTFKTCKWEKVTGAHIHIWSFSCGADFGSEHLVADDAVGGFDLATSNDKPAMVIRTFPIAAGASIDAALPAIRTASPGGKDTKTCGLVAAPAFDVWRGKLYTLEPTGAAKVAYDKADAVEPQDPPCGDLGIAPAGDRFFTLMPGDPTRVLYVDMGSEIQIFDPNTIGAN